MSARPWASSRSLRMSGDRSSRRQAFECPDEVAGPIHAHHAATSRQRERLDDRGEGAGRRQRRRIVGNRDVEKRGRQQTRRLEGAPAGEFVAAGSNRRRRIAGKSERLGDARGQNRRPIADGDDPSGRVSAQAATTVVDRAGLVPEANGNRPIRPGILELIAPIAGKMTRTPSFSAASPNDRI